MSVDILNPVEPEHAVQRAIPMTGAEFIDSLQDQRCVYFNGERVTDLTGHPAFRNSVRSLARLYDALHQDHDSGTNVLTAPADADPTGYTHRYFKVARSAEDLLGQQKAIAEWAKMSYGWMGRSPDYKAAIVNTLDANAAYYGPFADNARCWYHLAQQRTYFMNHAVANPPIDRAKPFSDAKDILVHVVKETDAGLYLSGAKVVATSAALTHYNFLSHHAVSETNEPPTAFMFFLDMSTPGIKLICRNSYEYAASQSSTPFDSPLSSRFDENDAILVLDNVFVPWENVLVYGPAHKPIDFLMDTGYLQGTCFHGCTRFAVKLDFLAGLLTRALHITSGDEFRGNQVLQGEVIALRHLFWSLSDAMARTPEAFADGAFLPGLSAAQAYRALAPDAYGRVKEIVQKIVASALIYLPSSAKDFQNPEIDGYLERYVRGSNGVGYKDRIKLMKLLWDATGSEFAGRHELYERNYAGNHEEVKLQLPAIARRDGSMDQMLSLVDQCLDDYDEFGWCNTAWKD
ncbi:Pyoverdin chromophore biosynthetic protein pvcC [Labrenzia sp. PO1]|uniref:4-hydroxyphenylacetate 3-hydroxylase N-terminal domain-containing protein n=1 Tax=Stappiaceae TaxID=2821832 RepID=UPI0014472C96|nr:4-hydroxyphenylacetate 3-hydroxylase N-terminal domain-containing protein [Labrenzia sp. PO1]NKI60227.1 Pyoverdin chromophore biosynthetic protein pvcC [Labrenzia sp. PO1]